MLSLIVIIVINMIIYITDDVRYTKFVGSHQTDRTVLLSRLVIPRNVWKFDS